jgi:phosphonate transport system substrate-binding protein
MGRNGGALVIILLMTIHWCPTLRCNAETPGSADERFHVGLSTSMFGDVKENDVKAAAKIWARTLYKERGVPIYEDVIIFENVEEVAHALRNRQVEAVVLQKQIRSERVVVSVYDGSYTEEYLLLVHKDSRIERVEDLKGRKLMFPIHPRMALAEYWLDIVLANGGHGPAPKFFNIEKLTKLPRAVLPVFFRQSDACVVTRRAFQTMCELNPQLGGSLKVIAASPKMVPGGFFFRSDASPSLRERTFASFEEVQKSPAYQQALILFQTQQLKVFPITILDETFALLAAHSRLIAASMEAR